MTGHFGTWPVPEAMVSIRAMTNLLVDAVDKKADYKDAATVQKYMETEAGTKIQLAKYDPKAGNQYLFLVNQIVY